MLARADKPNAFKNEKTIDIRENKKLRNCIYAVSIALAVLLTVAGNIFVPLKSLFSARGIVFFLLRLATIAIMMLMYFTLHEMIHILVAKRMYGLKAELVKEKLSASTLCYGYFSLKGYLIYCYAPIAVLGLFLLILMLALPEKAFWQVYIIQIINLAGAVGEIYSTIVLGKIKKEMLIRDSGMTLTYWTK